MNMSRPPYAGLPMNELKAEARAVRDLVDRLGVLLTQDGHTTGTIAFAHKETGHPRAGRDFVAQRGSHG